MACCFPSKGKAGEKPHVSKAEADLRWIELVEKDGAIVPRLHHFSEEDIDGLKEQSVEILDDESPCEDCARCYIVYIKQYSEQEQSDRGAEGFHRGYSLKSFFERFNELLPLVQKASIEAFQPFMDVETQAVFM